MKLVIDKNQPKNRRLYKLKKIPSLDKFIQNAFKRCLKESIYLWGVYPVANSYFMTPTITTKLKFIVGPMFGIINRHSDDLVLTIDEKENVERTLQYYSKDAGVIRFNNVTISPKYFKTPGGMQSSSVRKGTRKNNAFTAAHYLHKKYPKMTKIHLGKKSGWPEVKFLAK